MWKRVPNIIFNEDMIEIQLKLDRLVTLVEASKIKKLKAAKKPKEAKKPKGISAARFMELLEYHDACYDGQDYVQRMLNRGKTPDEVWRSCRITDFMHWWITTVLGEDWKGVHSCDHSPGDCKACRANTLGWKELRKRYPNLPLPEGE